MGTTETELGALETVAWVALEGAFEALGAGGLPCGAAISDANGRVVARGRNHAYDPVTGSDVLEGTPLAHAELNALARVRHHETFPGTHSGVPNNPVPCAPARSSSAGLAIPGTSPPIQHSSPRTPRGPG